MFSLTAFGIIGAVFCGVALLANNSWDKTSLALSESSDSASRSWWASARAAIGGPCAKQVDSLEAAEYFLDNCNKPKSTTAFINKGRALLIGWDSSATQPEKDQYFKRIETSFNQASELSPNDPEAAFYKAFMSDFKDFVLDTTNTVCTSASERYEKAISRYNQLDEITEETHNIFILNWISWVY